MSEDAPADPQAVQPDELLQQPPSEVLQPLPAVQPDNGMGLEVLAQEPPLPVEPASELPPEAENPDIGTKPPEAPEQEAQAKEPAEFSVRISRAMLDNIHIETPSVEEHAHQNFLSLEAAQAQIDAKLAQLSGVLEAVKHLPEQLLFQPGITLITGENAGGKSTLGRALHLVGEYYDMVRSVREMNELHGNEPTAGNPEDAAFESVFEVSSGTSGENLGMAGLGAYIAPAMLEGTTFLNHGLMPTYVDVAGMFGSIQAAARDKMQSSSKIIHEFNPKENRMGEKIVEVKGQGSFGFQSTRQTVDQELADYKQSTHNRAQQQDANSRGRIEFVDEPETGLSPRRHQKIAEMIYDIFGTPEEGNIVIVPTNSPILFQSDLPRIDLNYPERGIHRPSEYPDNDDIDNQ